MDAALISMMDAILTPYKVFFQYFLFIDFSTFSRKTLGEF
jgi:hypothetical protein